ncbi:DNA polymerase III subunit alpha [Patescibacteria group bacterium]|nr:DNA polymerase III subunit alpha [Patescibacteria group bacterium]
MFVHLHVHSHYSLLDGLAKIDELLNKTKEQGLKSLALTDHGTMYGTIEFYQKAKELGIKPIIGVEAYIARHGHTQKRPKLDISPYHIVLLAKNEIGYRNLLKLTTKAHLEGFYYKPRVDFKLLEKHNEGLIALSACLQGEIPVAILSGQLSKAQEAIKRYQNIFGRENFYLEIQNHPNISKQKTANEAIANLAQKTNTPLVATNDTHYLNADDDKVHDVLMCIQTQRTVTDENRLSMIGTDFSLRDPQDMITSFQDFPQATENTLKIAEQCNLEIKLGESKLPLFPVPGKGTTDDYLRGLCFKGLDRRYKIKDPANPLSKEEKEINERLNYELSVIAKTNFSSYFLIVQDLVNWAKGEGIVVGPGRGSAGGSLVSYLLNITDVDPIKYNLLFERFLNPERISMPDIDLDFADVRRDEVIEYAKNKYGKNKVAQIITFGTMAARAAVRDCGRALGFPYDYCDKIAKLIPMFNTLEEALRAEPELRELYNSDPQAKKLIDYSKKLEGVARHASTHACGTVISPEELDTYIPLQHASQDDQSTITQYEMHAVEDLGLLKMDFLGLKNLTIIQNALRIIDKVKKINIDIQTIPLDDKKAYELFQKGQTTGVFQFESAGMKRYLKQLKPTEFEDLIAMVALFRPGPMDWIPDYIAGKHGKKKAHYIHPKLKPILENTYGVAIYQEQVMQIGRDLAGFTLAEADVLRKAVGKKIKKLLLEQKKKFIDGCVANEINRKTAQAIFTFIEPFAGYGFNRSHAACYAMIAYQTAYLKAKYPTEFMAALLTADQENTDRVAIEITECEQMGLEVLPPDINESFDTFAVVPETKNIRFAFSAIKNLGNNIIEQLIEERKVGGKFANFNDFLKRTSSTGLNKKSLESLAMSGALDQLEERKQVLANMDRILEYIKSTGKANAAGQTDLFGSLGSNSQAAPSLKLEPVEPATKKERLAWEKELLGLYVSENPLEEYKEFLAVSTVPFKDIPQQKSDQTVKVGGVVNKAKKIITKKNQPMLFVELENGLDKIEVIVFPSLLEKNHDIWQEGKIVLVEGKLNDRDGEMKILGDEVREINRELIDKWETVQSMRQASSNRSNEIDFEPEDNQDDSESAASTVVKIKIPANASPALFHQLKEIFTAHQGKQRVILRVPEENGNIKEVKTNYLVDYSEEMAEKLKKQLS